MKYKKTLIDFRTMTYVVLIYLPPHPFHGSVQLCGRLLELLQGGVNEGRGVLLLGHVDHDRDKKG